MIESLTRNWWIQLIRGALAVTLGVIALAAPSTGMILATFLVAAFAIGDGAMNITTGATLSEGTPGRKDLVLAGAAFIVLGLVVLFWQSIPATALTLLFAAWLVASGALVAYGARTLSAEIPGSQVMLGLGAALIVAGLAVGIIGPATIDTFVTFAGWFGLVVGVVMAGVSLRLRADSDRLGARVTVAA